MRVRFERRVDSEVILLIYVIAAALFLRLMQLDLQPLWWDEGYTVFFATRDFATMLARTAVDIHPPLYYTLLQLWTPFAGLSDLAFRLFSVGVGLATIPLIYLFGRECANRRVGLFCAVLVAFSPLHVYYSQEVRMYGLATLLALASLTLHLYLLKSSLRPINRPAAYLAWTGYVLVTAAALYTLYYAVFLVAAETAVVLYWKWRGPTRGVSLRSWLAAWTAIGMLYLPWVIYAGLKLYTYVTAKVGIEQYSRLDPVTFLMQHLIAFSVGHLTAFPAIGAGAVLTVALAVYGVRCAQPALCASSPEIQIAGLPCLILNSLLLYFFIPLLIGWLVNLVFPFHPFGYERSLLYLAPLFYLFVALGLDALLSSRPRWAYAASAVLVLLAAGSFYDFYSTPRYAQEDYRPVISTIQEMAQAGDTVLAPYPWQIGYLEVYYRGAPLNIVEVPAVEWTGWPAQMEQALAQIHASSPRVWLLAWENKGHIIEDRIANFFAGDYTVYDDWSGNTRLEYFARGEDPPLDKQARDFAPDLQLTSFGLGTGDLLAGSDLVRLRLHWLARSNAYSYSLRLVNGSNETTVQQDFPIPAGDEIERRGILLPRALKAGDYQLRMVVYHRADGSPLTRGDTREFPLGRVTVETPR